MLLTVPDLDVAYRASPEPQALDIRVQTAGEAELPYARWSAEAVVQMVALGAAGGAELAPDSGHATLVGATPNDPAARGPVLAFHLEVAGMSPRFLRTIVEHFQTAGAPHPVKRLSIVGSLPLDRTSASVRDADVRAAFESPTSYAGAWRDVGFRVQATTLSRGFSARIELGGDATAHRAALATALSAWQFAVLTTPNLARTARGHMSPSLRVAATRREILVRAELFDHTPEPARAALVNVLARFHRVVAPIVRVEIGLP